MAFQTLNVYFLLENCIGVVWVETEVRFKLRFFEKKNNKKHHINNQVICTID